MSISCHASKDACDQLVRRFRDLSIARRDALQRQKAGPVDAPPDQHIASTNADPAGRPTTNQVASIASLTLKYFALRDANKGTEAYALLSAKQKQTISLDDFKDDLASFNAGAGIVQARRLREVTWYKDTPQGGPGLFVAVDYTSDFENLALHCGYVVWQEQPDGSFLEVSDVTVTLNKNMLARLKPGDFEAVRAKFRCK